MRFFKNFIKELLEEGHTVDIATNENDYPLDPCYREWGCKVFQMSWNRSPADIGNIKAISALKTIVADGQYDIVHCHTPIAAACTRIACRSLRHKGVRVIYTAHGFHFYKGAPLKNWVTYYPIEKLCSRWTDTLITINREDYDLALKRMKARAIEYVPGVGIDVEKFANTVVNKSEKRKEIGVPDDAFMLLSVGELNENKNHQIVIKALGRLNNPSVFYVIAGDGNQKDTLERLAESMGVRLILLGFRNDVLELYGISNCFILPSIREGLNVSLLEAMSSGLPCIVSKIRGNTDVVDHDSGIICEPTDTVQYCEAIERVLKCSYNWSLNNKNKVRLFDLNRINQLLLSIYGLEKHE